MNRTLKTILTASIVAASAPVHAGGGKSAAIGIGSGFAGFMLGRATAPQENVVERETVYIQEPPRTVTVACPYLQRDLQIAQDQLARERSIRHGLEAENTQLRSNLARSERTNDYLASQNAKLEAENAKLKAELQELKAPQVTTVVTRTPVHTCTSETCQIRKTGTPGVRKIEITEKEQY